MQAQSSRCHWTNAPPPLDDKECGWPTARKNPLQPFHRNGEVSLGVGCSSNRERKRKKRPPTIIACESMCLMFTVGSRQLPHMHSYSHTHARTFVIDGHRHCPAGTVGLQFRPDWDNNRLESDPFANLSSLILAYMHGKRSHYPDKCTPLTTLLLKEK